MEIYSKIVLAMTFTFAMAVIGYSCNDSMAQNATKTTKWTDRISDSPLFDGKDPSYPDTVDTIYESNKTVVLKSDYVDAIWLAVDLLKADGFKLDNFVTFVEYNDIVTMVVMSKP